MFPNIELQEGAIFIADAHYSHKRVLLLSLLEAIKSKKLHTPQLILMGDIFDALFGSVKYTKKLNAEIVKLLNDIAVSVEVVYLEGNHDFNLKTIFPNLLIIPIEKQPYLCNYKNKKILLAHGDFDVGKLYRIYTKIIRNSSVLNFISFLDRVSNHQIWKKLDNYLEKKDDCEEFKNFEKFIFHRIVNSYHCDYFIEGHFHQNRFIKYNELIYINLAAFACNQRYFIVKSSKDKELLEEKSFSKGI